MTIREWLSPEFFDINVVLVALVFNWTIYSIVSNFLVDFNIPPRLQSAGYFTAVIMTVTYFILVLALDPVPTLYPNPYDWLLIGNWPVFGSIIFGAATGSILAFRFGRNEKLRIGAAVAAVICETIITGLMLLWILNQS